MKALEGVEWKGQKEVREMVEEEVMAEKKHEEHKWMHPVKVGRKPVPDVEKVRHQVERKQTGVKEPVVGRKKGSSTLRRMFWAGVWVGGITGVISLFGK